MFARSWHKEQRDTGDVVYIFYANFVFGVGHLYCCAKQSISVGDTLMTYALFVPMLGLFKLVHFYNLTRECFLAFVKFLSAPEKVARDILASSTLRLSSRAFHAVATDGALEAAQGQVKTSAGSRWSVGPAAPGLWFALSFLIENSWSVCKSSRAQVGRAKVFTTLHFYFQRIKNQMKSLVVPVEVEDAALDEPKLKGKRVMNAGADIAAIASALRAFELFTVDPEAPRAGLDELPDGLARRRVV